MPITMEAIKAMILEEAAEGQTSHGLDSDLEKVKCGIFNCPSPAGRTIRFPLGKEGMAFKDHFCQKHTDEIIKLWRESGLDWQGWRFLGEREPGC